MGKNKRSVAREIEGPIVIRVNWKYFLKFVNTKNDEGNPAADKTRDLLRQFLDESIELGRKPDKEQAEWLHNEIELCVPKLSVLTYFDEKNIFGQKTRIWGGLYRTYFLGLIEILSNPEIGPRRLGKCEWCNRYFVAYHKSGSQRFCRSKRKGRKSMCAIKWHGENRKKHPIVGGKSRAQYIRDWRQKLSEENRRIELMLKGKKKP